MRRAALVTVLCFGCATSRPPTVGPVPLVGPMPARVALAEPTLELWMEGTHAPSEQESADALERSRAALARALEGRSDLDAAASGAPDALLALHARAVARTGERRAAQIGSVVAGVILFVAVVVVVIVLSTRGGGGKSRSATAFPATGRTAPAPVPWRGAPYRPAPPAPFFFGWSLGFQVEVPLAPAAPPPGPPPPGGAAPVAPAPDPLLDARGWLDGDEVELVAELVDARTGEVRWRRALRRGADPRSEREMRGLVDEVLRGAPLGRPIPAPAIPAPPPAETAPPAPDHAPDAGL